MYFKGIIPEIATVQPCPFISHQNIHFADPIVNWLVTYFMSGVRPIELIVQFALSEQAHTYKLYNQFCMAELLSQIGFDY